MARIGFWKTWTFLLLLLLCAPWAPAEMRLVVDVGWGGLYRPGAWTPLYVTLADSSPRNVILELHAPHDMLQEMSIRQYATANAAPTLYALYAPLVGSLADAELIVRDRDSGKELAHTLLSNPAQAGPGWYADMVSVQNVFLAVSGRPRTLRAVRGGLMQAMASPSAKVRSDKVQAATLSADRLPAAAVGYDALDVLLLDAPDLSALTLDQQQAIADWVRGGGNLILWPGPDSIPDAGPLIDMLPARIGDVGSVTLSDTERKDAGLGTRFTTLPTRALQPAPGAISGPLLGNTLLLRHRVGLGNVELLALDAGQLRFNDARSAARFWKPILTPLVKLPPADDSNNSYPQYTDNPRHVAAVQDTMDLLGNVPGVGRFGFSYVATTLIALMLIVGPIDWFILRRLGRLHWTWFTTTLWIALVTTGAIFIGHVLKSGDLHFRTLGIIDQAGGQTVGGTRMIGIYSPRTTDYTLAVPPRGWWQPPPASPYYFSGNAAAVHVPFHQDYRGNRPDAMLINVWNLRFLEETDYEQGPALIETALRLQPAGSGARARVVGKLVNRSSLPLKRIQIRTRAGVANVPNQVLAPGQSLAVNAPIETHNPFSQPAGPQTPYYYNSRSSSSSGLTGTLSYVTAGNLATRRAARIDRLLDEHNNLACIYGEFDDVQPELKLANPGAIQKHWRMLRALVPLENK